MDVVEMGGLKAGVENTRKSGLLNLEGEGSAFKGESVEPVREVDSEVLGVRKVGVEGVNWEPVAEVVKARFEGPEGGNGHRHKRR